MLDCPVMRWCLRALKWSLAALGAFLWVMLWYERHPLLGIVQAGIIGVLLLRELRTHLRRE